MAVGPALKPVLKKKTLALPVRVSVRKMGLPSEHHHVVFELSCAGCDLDVTMFH